MIYKILGITDEVTACDQCGKANLKRTIALEEEESGGVVYFGSDCAAMALGWSNYRGDSKGKKKVEKRATAVQIVNDGLSKGVAPEEICKRVRLETPFNSWYSNGTIVIIFQEDYGYGGKTKREYIEIDAQRPQ